MNRRPPGRSRLATTPAQRATLGSQQSAPIPVKTRSNAPCPAASAAAYTSDSTNLASAPVCSASARACLIAGPEKSTPVIDAPSLASEIVSVPMWHCRCTPRSPLMSLSQDRSNRTTSLRNAGSAMNESTL